LGARLGIVAADLLGVSSQERIALRRRVGGDDAEPGAQGGGA